MATTATTRPAEEDSAEDLARRLFETPEGRCNPYPLYHRLREAAPVHRSDSGIWLLSRYDDCRAALRDPRLARDGVGVLERTFGPPARRHFSPETGSPSLIEAGGAAHARLRRLVGQAFDLAFVDGLRPAIERTVDVLLDGMAEARGGDILALVGRPLPVAMLGEVLGLPGNDRPWLGERVRELASALEPDATGAEVESGEDALAAIRGYFVELVPEKRAHPGDDLLGRLVRAGAGDDGLTDDEVISLATLLVASGFEATSAQFGNGLLALLLHREQLAMLRADPALASRVPDEVARYDAAVQFATRFTTAEVSIGDATIPAFEQVRLLFGAANRDPLRYRDPDRLDLSRANVDALAFGGGLHHCLGAALARVEIEVALGRLVSRFGSIELLGEQPRFHDRVDLRGLAGLVVACRSGATPRPVPAAAAVAQPAAKPAASLDATAIAPRLDDPVSLLSRNAFFGRCDRAQLEFLAEAAYPLRFEPGDLLCVEGGGSPELYVVAEGQAVVTVGRKGVGTVGRDDVVGERGVLLDAARAATVTATAPMSAWAISRERLRTLAAGDPALGAWMLEHVRARYPQAGRSKAADSCANA